MGGGGKGERASSASSWAQYLRLSTVGFVVLDVDDGRLLETNEAFREICGRSEVALASMTLFDLLAPESASSDRRRLEEGAREGGVEVDLQCLRADGRPFTMALEAVVVGNGELVGLCRDVTEERQRDRSLRASDARFRALLSNAQAVIFMIDRDGTFLISEGKGLAALGLAPGQVVGTSARQMYAAYPPILRGIDEALEGRTHYTTVDVQGTVFDVFFSPSPGPDGMVEGAIGMAVDVSARVRADEERQRLALQVQQAQKLESLGLLAGGIAHDFNNLLVTILGSAEMLERELDASDVPLRRARRIGEAANQAAALCRQLLAYAGKTSIEVEPLDLNHILGEMMPLLEIAIAHGVELSWIPAEELPTIEADATQIGQVAMNLVSNASEALASRGGRIEVRTGTRHIEAGDLADYHMGSEREPGLYVYVEVADDGVGMDADTAQRLFEPFFTTKFTGRGLGMTTVRGIAQAHRGLLRIASVVGSGTTITVFFPASEARPGQGPVVSDTPPPAQRDGTVLVVDDEETVLRTVSMLLGGLGFEVVGARSGAEALLRLEEAVAPIRCVVLDVTMPQMSGVECLQRIRQRWPALAVVLTSGYAAQEVAGVLAGDPHTTFLQKPFRLASLCDRLDEVAPVKARS